MNEKELREIMKQLEEQGWNPLLCDTPVPYYDNPVKCGKPTGVGDVVEEKKMFPREFLSMQPEFVVKVKGDSEFSDGDIVVALLDGETTLKSYCRDDDGEVWLVPANNEYLPIRMADYQTVYVLGKVTCVRKKMPRASFSMMQRRLKIARQTADKVVTDERVREAVTQVLAAITVSRMWFCVYRVLADVGYLPKCDYEALRERMDKLFPDNDFSINPRDISRMDVGSFSKGFQLWNEQNAPVTGKRFKDYRNLAESLYRLIKA